MKHKINFICYNKNIKLLEERWFIDKNYKEEINFKQG